MNGTIEHHFHCPYCGEEISMIIEPLDEEQSYVEDCEVCCRPIQIHVAASEDHVIRFDAHTLE